MTRERDLWRRRAEVIAVDRGGVISAADARHSGASRSAVRAAVRAERLFELHPSVYSIVPLDMLPRKGHLAGAVLAGGKGAGLCGVAAAEWLETTERRSTVIDVAVTSTRKPIRGVRFRELVLGTGEIGMYRGLSVTSPARTPLDFAAAASHREVRSFLAELEFRFGITAAELTSVPRRGHPGSARLRAAIAQHLPQLAATRSELERAFLELLEDYGFPIPEINHPIGLTTVDALFHEQRIIVELDGLRAHAGERRILRDHRRDLHRRAEGYRPLRYHYEQVMAERDLVAADLARAGLARPAPPRMPEAPLMS